jgi:ElaB/YqjD/DUF883 family membrane-anchored ribosome-binding protein
MALSRGFVDKNGRTREAGASSLPSQGAPCGAALEGLCQRKELRMAVPPKDKEEAAAAAAVVSDEIAALRTDLAELGSLVARIGRQRAAGLKAAAGATAHEGYQRGEAVYDDALAELRSLEDELVEAARRRPFAALGIAALLGFLFGVMFRR